MSKKLNNDKETGTALPTGSFDPSKLKVKKQLTYDPIIPVEGIELYLRFEDAPLRLQKLNETAKNKALCAIATDMQTGETGYIVLKTVTLSTLVEEECFNPKLEEETHTEEEFEFSLTSHNLSNRIFKIKDKGKKKDKKYASIEISELEE